MAPVGSGGSRSPAKSSRRSCLTSLLLGAAQSLRPEPLSQALLPRATPLMTLPDPLQANFGSTPTLGCVCF